MIKVFSPVLIASEVSNLPSSSIVTELPSPSSEYSGIFKMLRIGIDNVSTLFVCTQNDANVWEWVQIGIST